MRKNLKKILSDNKRLLLAGCDLKVAGKKFIGFYRPGVYIMSKRSQHLYVGSCRGKVIKRAVVSNEEALNHATDLHILPCKNPKAARSLERVLIEELSPEYNKRGKVRVR